MGRAPCCDKANVKKGPWSPEEDRKLKEYIETHGTGGNWIALPQKAGLRRCGHSCRLRWLNYLRCAIFASIGSRRSIMAAQLPGRTNNDIKKLPGRTNNDIKNYWNTKLKKKMMSSLISIPENAQREKGRASVEKGAMSSSVTDHEIVPAVESSITVVDEIVPAVESSIAVVDEIVQAERFHSRFIRNAFGENQPGNGRFIVGSFLALLQIKSQGKSEFPFETHARTMSLCVISLSIYAVAYAAQHIFSVSNTDRTNVGRPS